MTGPPKTFMRRCGAVNSGSESARAAATTDALACAALRSIAHAKKPAIAAKRTGSSAQSGSNASKSTPRNLPQYTGVGKTSKRAFSCSAR
jgi:hypothetical protein